jgi:hypothetical protein
MSAFGPKRTWHQRHPLRLGSVLKGLRYFRQCVGNQLFCVKSGQRGKRSLGVVGYLLKRAHPVAESLQPVGVPAQEFFRSQNSPLDDVDELVEVDGFVFGDGGLQEEGVEIRDAIEVAVLEYGKLRKTHP